MNPFEEVQTIGPGDPAPDFTVPWIERDGSVSLGDYAGRPVLLALMRGLWCPFCRRGLANLAAIRDDLAALGVETLGIVAAEPEGARVYLRYRPSRIPLAADPALVSHSAYGLPHPPITPELMAVVETVHTDANGELPEPLPFTRAAEALNRIDGYSYGAGDEAEMDRAMTQFTGHFLIDAGGIVRWTDVECAREGLAGLGKHPDSVQVLAAARALA